MRPGALSAMLPCPALFFWQALLISSPFTGLHALLLWSPFTGHHALLLFAALFSFHWPTCFAAFFNAPLLWSPFTFPIHWPPCLAAFGYLCLLSLASMLCCFGLLSLSYMLCCFLLLWSPFTGLPAPQLGHFCPPGKFRSIPKLSRASACPPLPSPPSPLARS